MPLDKIFKTQTVELARGFSCDICKRYYAFENYTASRIEDFSSLPNFFHAVHTFGYGSFEDGSKVEITICDDCLLVFCDGHKIRVNRLKNCSCDGERD